MNIIWKGSPNFTKGRGGKKVDTIVLHWIVGYLPAADAVFSKPDSVSAHYAVGPKVIHQYVDEANTAYHAGDFTVNQRSIGIEHEGGPNIPITDAVYNTSIELVADICQRNGIVPSSATIKPHKAFRATQCPGTLDIDRIIRGAQDRLQGDIEMGMYTRPEIINKYREFEGRDPREDEILFHLNNSNRVTFLEGFGPQVARIRTDLQNKPPQIIKEEVIKEVPVEVIKEVVVEKEKIVYQDKPLTLGQAIKFIIDVIKSYFRKESV